MLAGPGLASGSCCPMYGAEACICIVAVFVVDVNEVDVRMLTAVSEEYR